jgi:glycogen synthase
MRLLFLSNYYPPDSRGGYEQWCQEVADALSEKGHEVTVITSPGLQPANARPAAHPNVYRIMELEVMGGVANTVGRLANRNRIERSTLDQVRTIIARTQPDAALIWGMWNVPRSVPALVEQLLPSQTAYYFCDYWPSLPSAFLQQLGGPARHRTMALAKQLVGRLALRTLARETRPMLRFLHPICVSAAVRRLLVEAGVPVGHARIIRGGTPVMAGPPAWKPSSNGDLRLVYLGRLAADKGVHTAIQAIGALAARGTRLHLDIWGKGDADYERSLREQAAAGRHFDSVRFCGAVARSEVPALLGNYHALVFPSQWEEPFARTVLEAMAAGLAVVGTTTGGTGEILKDGKTGLTFAAGDADDLAACLARLAGQPDLLPRLGRSGYQTVLEHFTFDRMVTDLEGALRAVAGASHPASADNQPRDQRYDYQFPSRG